MQCESGSTVYSNEKAAWPDPNGDDRQRKLGRNMRVARQQMWIDTGFWAYEMEYSVVWSTCQLRVNGRVGTRSNVYLALARKYQLRQ